MDTFVLIGIIVLVVLSLTTHEAGHAWIADRLGDPTPRALGRVTLNPIPHIDLVFTILLPAVLLLSGANFLFGGAKPVLYNPTRLRKPRRDFALVALAGPATNLGLALLFSVLLAALLQTAVFTVDSGGTRVLAIGVFANVLLFTLNMLPIPPLDGSKVLSAFLEPRVAASYIRLERFGLLLFLGLFYLVPPFAQAFFHAVLRGTQLITAALGVRNEAEHAISAVLGS